MRKLIILLALLTLTPRTHAQSFQQPDLFINVNTTCASTMTFTLAGVAGATNNTAFILNLNCNVTSSSIAGFPQVGNRIQFSITNAGSFTFAWPSNFLNPPTVKTTGESDISFWYDGTNWHTSQTVTTASSTGNNGDLQANGGSGTFIASHINDNGTNLSLTETLTAAGSENVWLKPPPGFGTSSGFQYVTSWGNDSNDGLSWGTAKLTIFAALIALPGGSASPPQAGGGTVYFSDGVFFNANHACGLWFVAPTDPNYNSPPACYMRTPNFTSINLIGQGCGGQTPNGGQPSNSSNVTCDVEMFDFVGVGNGGTNNPALHLEGAGAHIENMNIVGQYGRCMTLGIDSTGNRTGTTTGAADMSFHNMGCHGADGVDTNGVGRGPAIDISGNTFNIYFDQVVLGVNLTVNQSLIATAPTGLVVNNGVLTVTFTAANTAYFTGESCGIVGAQNPAYNFTAHNNGTAGTGITVVDGTHVTMPTSLANGTSGGGLFLCDRGIPIVQDGVSSAGGNLNFNNAVINGGGIKSYGGGVNIKDVYSEGDFTHPIGPEVWFLPTGGGLAQNVNAFNVGVADQSGVPGGGSIAVFKVEGNISPESVQITGAIEFPYTEGPLTYHGDNNYNVFSSPLARGQWGVVRGHLEGQTDVHRRSPQSTRYINFAPPSQFWGLGGGTLVSNITDIDGGTGAFQLNGASSLSFMNGNPNPGVWNVGDAGICGVWMKSLGTPNAYTGNAALLIACNTGVGNAQITTCNFPVVNGDGEWDWYWCEFTVLTTESFTNFSTGSLSNSIQVYAPTLIHIPAGQLSGNDLTQLAWDMRSLPSVCSVGQMCDNIGPIPHLNVGTGWTAVQTFPGAATSQFFDVQQVAVAPANPPVAGCRLFTLSGVLNGVSSTGTNCLPSGGGGGGGNVSSGGTPVNGQMAQWINSTTIQGVTLLPTSAFPALTQDVNNTAGSLVTTVNGLKGNPVPTLGPGWLQWNGSVFAWTNPPTNVGAASTVGDLASYNSLTTVADSGVVAANVVTNTTNLVNANLVQGTGNHTVADSTIPIANVTQNSISGTTNVIPKWSAPHTLTNSSVSDNGTFIIHAESADLQANALVSEYSNAGSTGTTLNKLAKFTGAPSSVVLAATTDTNGIIGICVGNCGTTGTAQIAISGQASCVFSNATTAGHYVQISSATAGDCVDSNSATPPATGQIIGRVLSTNGSAGTYVIDLYAADLSAGGSGGGSGTVNSASQFSIPFYSAAGTSNVISGVAAPTSPNNVPYFWVSTPNAGLATAPQLLLGGVPVNSNLGTTPYNMATTDRLSELQGNPSTAFVINLPNGNTSGFSNNFASVIRNYGTAPFNLAAPTGINVNGVSAGVLTHLPNWTAWMWQDASNNLWVSRMPTHEAFGPTCPNGVTWSTTTGLGCLSSLPILSTSAAGGDLSGTYPNPTVGSFNGLAIPANALALGTNGSAQPGSAALAGTDTKLMTAGVVTGGAGTTICLDANNGITSANCTGPVLTLTGDGTLITNSASTGAVTLTLGTAAAHKVWMNNTGSTATPGYQSIGTADLPTGIPNANLANASTTPNGQTCTLGSTCNVNNGASSHTVALNEGAGTAITGLSLGAGTTIQGAASADPTATMTPTLGIQNTASDNGSLTLAGSNTLPGTLVLNNTGTTPKTLTISPGSVATVAVTGPNTSGTMLVSSTTDFPEVLVIPAANCNNTNGGAGWSIGSGGTVTCRAGTNNLGGYISITDTASSFATFQIAIPEDWDIAVNPYIRFQLASTDATNAHTVIPEFRVACYKGDGSTTDDVAPNAFHSSSTVTLNGNANRFWSTSNVQMNATDVTGCVAGALMQVTVGRATDTATNAEFYSATITIPRTLTVQAN